MSKKANIIFTVIISFFCSIFLFGQDLECVRYKITPQLMLDLIEKYPEKKESIEKKIERETPNYVDFILIDSDILQIYWGHDTSLLSINIYTSNTIYTLSTENELTVKQVPLAADSLSLKKLNNVDTLYQYNLTEDNAMPLTIKLKDSLTIESIDQKTRINNYPEISFIRHYKVFPETLLFGKPKPMMTLDSRKVIKQCLMVSKDEYLELLENIQSKDKRSQFLSRIIRNRKS